MLTWKKVDVLFQAVKLLQKTSCCQFTVDLYGTGPQEDHLQKMIDTLGLQSMVHFHDPIPSHSVEEEMQKSHIYVCPSTRKEGWGVAINEAMANGCVVIANSEAGASEVLIKPSENGFLFSDGDFVALANLMDRVMTNWEEYQQMGTQAWSSLFRNWRPEVGAERLLELSAGLLAGNPPAFDDGPGSRA